MVIVYSMYLFIDEKPFTILFGACGENFSFEIDVKTGFISKVNLDNDIYYQLINFFNIASSPENQFKPGWFFTDFNKHIPKTVNFNNIPKPQKIIM